MSSDLLIKINADAKNAQKAFDDIRAQTEDLEGQLAKVAQVSAVAFAAFTAEIYFSVKAFNEAERASVQLTNALQNQGIFTTELKNKYSEYADAVQAKTGIDNDAVMQAQAVAQTYLGQTKITGELTQAIADLSATMGGDLNGAAEKIARTIGTGVNAFARQGLVIQETATEAERYAKVLEFVQLKAGGLAEEFNKADGYTKALATSFGNLQEGIGARFAPVVSAVRQAFISLFNYLESNPVLLDLAAAAIAAGVAVTGLIAFVAAAVPAFLAISAAAATFGVAMNVAFLGIPLLIAAVVAGVTLLALNWDKAMAGMKSAAVAAVTLISELFGGLGQILRGALEFDTTKMQAGLEQLKGAFAKTKEAAIETYTEIRAAQNEQGEAQNADKKALADKEAAKEAEHQARLRAIKLAEIEVIRLQNENASAELIALKQREIESIKALDQEQNIAAQEAIKERLQITSDLQEEARQQEAARNQEFADEQTATRAELAKQGLNADVELSLEKQNELRNSAQTELDVDRKLYEDKLKLRIDANNKEALERKKYGAAYAVINRAINSEEVQATKQAAGDLVELSQSKNETLKGIGKAASIAQITIKTAEAAMNIYNGFSIIPIVGPALGIAGAAAAVAFGAERISAVTAAADGGLITGGVAGKDSVPALLMPGELVVPERNFDQVVGAVQRDNQGGGDPEMVGLLQQISQKLDNVGNTIIQGDVMTDDSYIDALVRRISDAVELRNAQIFGVNT
jgi:hypothetical protein